MKKLGLVIITSMLFSCGTRKVQKQAESISENNKTEISQQQQTETKSEISTASSYKFSLSDFGLNIKPVDGQLSYFRIVQGRDTLKVETNAEASFTRKHEKTDYRILQKTLLHQKWISQISYKTHTTYKTKTLYRKSESKRSAFAWYILAFVLGAVALRLIQTQIPVLLQKLSNRR